MVQIIFDPQWSPQRSPSPDELPNKSLLGWKKQFHVDIMDCSTDDEDSQGRGGSSTSISVSDEDTPFEVKCCVPAHTAHSYVAAVWHRIYFWESAISCLKQVVLSLSDQTRLDAADSIDTRIDAALEHALQLNDKLVADLNHLGNLLDLKPEENQSRERAISRIQRFELEVASCKASLTKLRKGRSAPSMTLRALTKTGVCCKQLSERVTAVPEKLQPIVRRVALAKANCFWEKLKLSLTLEIREDVVGYSVSAAVPNLDIDTLKVETSAYLQKLVIAGSCSLTISGICLPSEREEDEMRQNALVEFDRLDKSCPTQLRSSSEPRRFADVLCSSYSELGAGKFGRFSESIRVPKDVDIESIKSYFHDGVLVVTLLRLPSSDRSK